MKPDCWPFRRSDLAELKAIAEPDAPEIKCACVRTDAYDCYRTRYPSPLWCEEVELDEDGGPCECPCHDGNKDDWL